MALYDETGREAGRLEGSYPAGTTVSSPWIYSESFSLRIVTNGVNDVAATGFTIAGIDVLRGPTPQRRASSPLDLHRGHRSVEQQSRKLAAFLVVGPERLFWHSYGQRRPPSGGSSSSDYQRM